MWVSTAVNYLSNRSIHPVARARTFQAFVKENREWFSAKLINTIISKLSDETKKEFTDARIPVMSMFYEQLLYLSKQIEAQCTKLGFAYK